MSRRPISMRASVLCAASGAALSMAALAAPALAQAPENAVQEVVVTASRVARTGFTAPTPTTVVTAADFERRAPNNVAEVLNEIPAFRGTSSPTTSTGGGTGTAQTFADLRGLGSVRTLTLVNGRRHVPTATTGQTELGLIPTLLIERTEVVTGGASAAWGSDAVAGVLNLILKNKMQGVEMLAQYGVSGRGDDKTWKFGAAAGTAFAGGRGHVMVGGEFSQGEGVLYKDRFDDWIRGRASVTNTAFATNGQPFTIYANYVQFATQTPGGVITGTPNTPAANALKGIAFGPNGTLYRFQQGQVFGASMIGGEQPLTNNNYGFFIKAPIRRGAAYSRVEYQLTDKVKGFVEASIGQVKSDTVTVVPRDSGSTSSVFPAATAPITTPVIIARIDNPFMPAALRDQLVAAGVSQVYVGRHSQEIGGIGVHISNMTKRAVLGFEGDLGGGWKWDAYYQYGRNHSDERTKEGRRVEDLWRLAIDVVANPANGQPICRSTLTNPNNGCVPFNIFGPGASSAAARKYVSADGFVVTDETQQVASVNLRGDLFNVIAGPVSLAVGAEYRKEEVTQAVDPIAKANRFQFGNALPTNGSLSVKEAYAEVVVPLAKDLRFARSVDLDLAGRHTDYSTSGGVNTWKVGLTWAVDNQIRFRGTLSRDIRAANVSELYISSGTTPFTPTDRILGIPAPAGRLLTSGNPDLRPEKALTWTTGMVYQPEWFRGFRASVDYYSIDIKDQIVAVGGQTIIDRCALGLTSYCPLIVRNPDPANAFITDVKSPFLNLNEFKTSGIDFEAIYARPMSALFGEGAPGDFVIRGLATYTHELTTIDAVGPIDRAGQNGGAGVPSWTGTGTIVYNLGGFSGSVQGRYVDGGNIDNLAVPGTNTSANKYTVPSTVTWALSASYDMLPRSSSSKIQVFGVVDNVLDNHPPFPFVQSPYYDSIGRAFRFGVRLKH